MSNGNKLSDEEIDKRLNLLQINLNNIERRYVQKKDKEKLRQNLNYLYKKANNLKLVSFMNHNRMYNILKNDANKKIGLLEEIKSKPKLKKVSKKPKKKILFKKKTKTKLNIKSSNVSSSDNEVSRYAIPFFFKKGTKEKVFSGRATPLSKWKNFKQNPRDGVCIKSKKKEVKNLLRELVLNLHKIFKI